MGGAPPRKEQGLWVHAETGVDSWLGSRTARFYGSQPVARCSAVEKRQLGSRALRSRAAHSRECAGSRACGGVASTLGNLGRCLGRLGAWKASRRPRRQFAPSRPLGAPTDVSMLDALEKQHEEDKAARKEAIKDVTGGW